MLPWDEKTEVASAERWTMSEVTPPPAAAGGGGPTAITGSSGFRLLENITQASQFSHTSRSLCQVGRGSMVRPVARRGR